MSSCFPSASLLNTRSPADVTSASCHVIQPATRHAQRPNTLNCAALNAKSRHAARKLRRADLGIGIDVGIGYGGGSISDSEVASLAATEQTSVTRNNRLHHHHHQQHSGQTATASKTNTGGTQRLVRLRDHGAPPRRMMMQAICESPEIMSSNSNSTDICRY